MVKYKGVEELDVKELRQALKKKTRKDVAKEYDLPYEQVCIAAKFLKIPVGAATREKSYQRAIEILEEVDAITLTELFQRARGHEHRKDVAARIQRERPELAAKIQKRSSVPKWIIERAKRRRAEAVEKAQNGLASKLIAKELGVSRQRVYAYLNEANVAAPTRVRHRKKKLKNDKSERRNHG